MKPTFAPFARPLYVMSKPIGSACNLACDYCYYLEKANLYKQSPKQVMSDELFFRGLVLLYYSNSFVLVSSMGWM